MGAHLTKYEQNSQQRIAENRIVAAIDFGTTYSGYAFAFEKDIVGVENPSNYIITNEWTSSNGETFTHKAPTTVLFDPSGNFHSFGYRAEQTYAALVEDDNEDHTAWYCFKRFKMKLHDQMRLQREFEISDEHGRVMPALKVFAESIKFLKDDLIRSLKKRNPGFDGPNLWVLTVPAIWDEPAKQFMREAAKEAGIERHMILALEPESAAIYCKSLQHGSFIGTTDQKLKDCFNPGGMYMVLDLGGGTVDTAVHGIKDDCSIKEIHEACGGAWGGTKVDEEFFYHIINQFGDRVIPVLKEKFPSEWLKLNTRLENMKKQVTYSKEYNAKLEIPTKMVLYSQKILRDLTKYGTNLQIQDVDLKRFFKSPAEKIEQHIKNILEKFPVLEIIFMVGGFSESQYIQEYLKAKFPNKQVIVPFNAKIAVLKGAVITGFNELSGFKNPNKKENLPFQVTKRISRFTYGVRICKPFIEGEHLRDNGVFIDGAKVCKNIFRVFVKEGECVGMFEERSAEVYSSHEKVDRRHIEVHFAVFASRGKIPTYTTESNCRYLGEINIKPPKEGWPNFNRFLVVMYFGRSEVSIEVRDQTDTKKEPYISTFDFLA